MTNKHDEKVDWLHGASSYLNRDGGDNSILVGNYDSYRVIKAPVGEIKGISLAKRVFHTLF